MMFLAHFTGTELDVILNWNITQIYFWHNQAVKLHNQLNESKT